MEKSRKFIDAVKHLAYIVVMKVTEQDERDAKWFAGKDVWAQTNGKNRTAYYFFSHQQMRYFPLRKAVATLMIAAGSPVKIKQKSVHCINQGAA